MMRDNSFYPFIALLILSAGLQRSLADTVVPTTCKDETLSSATGKDVCRGHGGIKNGAVASAAESAAATPLSIEQGGPTVIPPPSSRQVQACQDGTTVPARVGACKDHGGAKKTSRKALEKPTAGADVRPSN
jgi:hypothetical protein